ncbi:hypothetical protein AGDE_00498 [Angomonas deanei]|nr:hypothetical protein AGDE_00498 [Angomonas deanei]|eukprot:EPY43423.1 hypothetical protein AGDE_00498 [Angomonas deanei]
MEEEKAANNIVRKIDDAKNDVKRYNVLLEEEKKARTEIRRKIKNENLKNSELELELDEREQYFLTEMQKKLLDVVNEKQRLELEIRQEREKYLALLSEQLNRVRLNCDDSTYSTGSLTESSVLSASHPCASDSQTSTPQTVSSIDTATNSAVTKVETVQPRQGVSPSYTASEHHAVVKAEHKLNKLLQEHAEAAKEAEENERLCAQLSEKLKKVGEEAFLNRAQVVKMKENLQIINSKMDNLDSSMEGSYSSIMTPCRSIDLSSSTYRDRVKDAKAASKNDSQ